MNFEAKKEIKPRSLLLENEIKERRQMFRRTVKLPPLLNKADIADYFSNLLVGLQIVVENTEPVMG